MSPSSSSPDRHRLGALLGIDVLGSDGRRLGHVNDVRLAPTGVTAGVTSELVVDGLSSPDGTRGRCWATTDGPSRARHWCEASYDVFTGAGYAPWATVRDLDWDRRVLTLDLTTLEPLRAP
ncbi:MAG: hypothetical protein H0U61_12205 [Nocardioidaceae bacterium]|nr:hypothetical protein [Nocardioidaceae bacterium]